MKRSRRSSHAIQELRLSHSHALPGYRLVEVLRTVNDDSGDGDNSNSRVLDPPFFHFRVSK